MGRRINEFGNHWSTPTIPTGSITRWQLSPLTWRLSTKSKGLHCTLPLPSDEDLTANGCLNEKKRIGKKYTHLQGTYPLRHRYTSYTLYVLSVNVDVYTYLKHFSLLALARLIFRVVLSETSRCAFTSVSTVWSRYIGTRITHLLWQANRCRGKSFFYTRSCCV